MTGLLSGAEHRRLVRRAWCVLNGVAPDELEAEIDARAGELREQISAFIDGESASATRRSPQATPTAPDALEGTS